MKKVVLLIIGLFIVLMNYGALIPKTEFRSVWLTTVWSLDWPSVKGTDAISTEKQQQQLIAFFDKFQAANMNVVFFQVRSMSDAMYQSSFSEEPWSQFLTGHRGETPSYDPLAFAIELAHARGMELHAWLNPYRYSSGESSYGNLPTDYSVVHPDWLITCANGSAILNPGVPEVRKRIVDVAVDIVSNYDVDGVVFDDYFYVEGMTDDMDQTEYDTYNEKELIRGDWRRENVNNMVRDVYAAIKNVKPWCRFGIGPAGISASKKEVADKYGIKPCDFAEPDWQYDGIFSEPVAWLMDGSIDYISPQVYWPIGSSNDFSLITPWWYEVAEKFHRHCYISHSLSGLGRKFDVGEVPAQVTVTREANMGIRPSVMSDQSASSKGNKKAEKSSKKLSMKSGKNAKNQFYCGTSGSVFFAANRLVSEKFHVNDSLLASVYAYKALPPAITWFAKEVYPAPQNLKYENGILSWDGTAPRYSVYVYPQKTSIKNVVKSAEYLMGMTYTSSYDLSAINVSGKCVAICPMDRYGNESDPIIYKFKN